MFPELLGYGPAKDYRSFTAIISLQFLNGNLAVGDTEDDVLPFLDLQDSDDLPWYVDARLRPNLRRKDHRN